VDELLDFVPILTLKHLASFDKNCSGVANTKFSFNIGLLPGSTSTHLPIFGENLSITLSPIGASMSKSYIKFELF